MATKRCQNHSRWCPIPFPVILFCTSLSERGALTLFQKGGGGETRGQSSKPRIINSVAHACRSLKHLREDFFYAPHFLKVQFAIKQNGAYRLFGNIKGFEDFLKKLLTLFFILLFFCSLTVCHIH